MQGFNFIITFMKSLILLLTSTMVLALTSCTPNTGANTYSEAAQYATPQGEQMSQDTQPYAMIPNAVAYKTNGDYINNVTIVLNQDGTLLLSYPAPSDITKNSIPVPLSGGWILDNRGGISHNTAFTTFTWEQYMELPEAPAPYQLLERIIPGAKVTAIEVLPFKFYEVTPALADSVLKARNLL